MFTISSSFAEDRLLLPVINPFTHRLRGIPKPAIHFFWNSQFCRPTLVISLHSLLQSGPKSSFWSYRLFADGSTALHELTCGLATLGAKLFQSRLCMRSDLLQKVFCSEKVEDVHSTKCYIS
jgi:hypothetical protein